MADAKHVHSDEDDEKYVTMGARLRQAREYLGFSQETVAEALGVPRASVSAMESGRRKVSSLELRDLACHDPSDRSIYHLLESYG